jgi:glycosyltransferase involved in cell wall biosynthesis
MSYKSRVLVLIPAYNEAATVGNVIARVLQQGLAVLVVDDGSSDDTARVAVRAGANCVQLPFNLGVGGALRCGFRWAVKMGYDCVVQCDADGQHSPEEIVGLIEFAEDNRLHLAIGSRFLGDSPFKSSPVRRIPMRLMAKLASRAAGVKITDTSSGFRAIRQPLLSEFAREFPVHYLGDTFDVTIEAAKSGYRIDEMPTTMHERAGGVPSSNAMWSLIYLARSFLVLLIGPNSRYQLHENEIE